VSAGPTFGCFGQGFDVSEVVGDPVQAAITQRSGAFGDGQAVVAD